MRGLAAVALSSIALTGCCKWFGHCAQDTCYIKPTTATPLPVVVGCDVADPNLGCTERSPLDVELQFEAPAGWEAQVTVNNPPQGLVVGDGGRTDRAAHIVLKPGTTVLRGFSTADRVLSTVSWTVTAANARAAAERPPPQGVKFRVIQMVAATIVQRAEIAYAGTCPAPPLPVDDKVALSGIMPTADAVVLLDGRRTASPGQCVINDGTHGANPIGIGNMLADNGCPARATVFTDAAAVDHIPSVTTWHDPTGDELPATLDPPVTLPMKIFLLWDWCMESSCTPAEQAEAANGPNKNFIEAQAIYAAARAGIQLSLVTPVVDLRASAQPNQYGVIGCSNPSATLEALVGLTGPPAANTLNVYYLKRSGGNAWCGGNVQAPQENMILIGSSYWDTTLAHEIGHALMGVWHAERNNADVHEDFSNEQICANLMNTQNASTLLTIGQVYRASLSRKSVLNRFRPAAPGTLCESSAAAGNCPCDAREASSTLPLPAQRCPPQSFDVTWSTSGVCP